MALKKIRLGDYIVRSTKNNHNLEYGADLIVGVTNDGIFANPRGDNKEVNLKPYKIVDNGAFVYNPSRLNLGSIAYRTDGLCIVSHLYQIFYLNEEGKKIIDPEWLFIYFRRKSFYREVTFRNFGSQRPEFNFNDMSEIFIPLPDIDIQRKYAKLYRGMMNNLHSYEKGLEDLKLVCDAYLEDLRKQYRLERLGDYIQQYKEINGDLKVTRLAGLIGGEVEEARKSSGQDNLSKFQIIYPKSIVYPPPHFGEIGTIGIVENEPVLMSPMYVTFKARNDNELNMNYILMWCRRDEFKRFAFFSACSSVRDTFDFDLLSEYRLPIPKKEIQDDIVAVFKSINKRRAFINNLKQKTEDICPVLIQGSVLESKGGI